VSSEISGNLRRKISRNFRTFIVILPEISGNLSITYVSQLFPSPALQSDAGMFLTNNSPDLYALTLYIMFRNNPVLARLYRISTNSNGHYRLYNFRAFANISGNFQKIHGKMKFPESLQP